jgi:hypothetical protein
MSIFRIQFIAYTVALTLSFYNVIGQNFDKLTVDIKKSGQNLQSGPGLRAPQFCNINLNGDEQLDLLVYDRVSDLFHTYIKQGSPGVISWKYAPEYEKYFPSICQFIRVRDYNGDGVEDIFTASKWTVGGISLYKGNRNAEGKLSFSLVTFDYGFRNALMIPSGSSYTTIYVSPIDTPDMVDVDRDGDMDILAFESGGSFVSWYKNLQVEEGFKRDSVKFKLGDICWGKFSEGGMDDSIFLSDDPFSCAQGIVSNADQGLRHSGSTLSVMDVDGDTDYDIALGDISSTTIKLLVNGGSPAIAHMTSQERGYPADNISPEMRIYLAPFFVDIDGDNKLDYIVTINESIAGDAVNHIWAYKNVSPNNLAKFELLTKRFLIDDYAYFNGSSAPTFIDIDADNLQDIIVGTNTVVDGIDLKNARLVYLHNIGTTSNPSYEILDDNYLNVSALYPQSGQRFRPKVGDLDSDGDIDLMVGISNGTVCYYENIAGPDQIVKWSNPKVFYSDIFVGQNASPAIYDLDQDGLMDIICGENNNQLNFIKNIGSQNIPQFNGNMTQLPNFNDLGFLFKYGNDPFTRNGDPNIVESKEGTFLLMPNQYGNIGLWSNIFSNDIYTHFFTRQDSVWNEKNLGKYVKIDLADLDDDGYYEMAVGNEAGGIEFYNTPIQIKTSNVVDETKNESINIFPNPAQDIISIYTLSEKSIKQAHLYDLTGRYIMELKTGVNYVGDLQSGTYVAKITLGQEIIIKNIVLVK